MQKRSPFAALYLVIVGASSDMTAQLQPYYRAKILDYPGCRTKSVLYLIAGRLALGPGAGAQVSSAPE